MIPILESLSKVKDVRTVIRKIIDKMSPNYESTTIIQDQGYQDDINIKFEDREKYIQVIGNYHPDAEEYNPARLSRNMPMTQNTMMTSNSIRFSNEEINAFVFNHLHWQYSNNEPADQVIYDVSESQDSIRKEPVRDRKGFFK